MLLIAMIMSLKNLEKKYKAREQPQMPDAAV